MPEQQSRGFQWCGPYSKQLVIVQRRGTNSFKWGREICLSGSSKDGQFVLTAAGAGKETAAGRNFKQVGAERVAKISAPFLVKMILFTE